MPHDLSQIADSVRASRYAVSSVNAGGQPTLTGAQITGGTAGAGGSGGATTVVGEDSVAAVTQANMVTLQLQGDAAELTVAEVYGSSPTGVRGWQALASLILGSASVTVNANANGTLTLTASGGSAGAFVPAYAWVVG